VSATVRFRAAAALALAAGPCGCGGDVPPSAEALQDAKVFGKRSDAAVLPPAARTIPLCPGLRVVTAIARPEGDYESIKTVTAVGPAEVAIAYSAQVPKGPGMFRNFQMRRTVRRRDLEDARLYAHYFHTRGSVTIPGSTAIGVSRAVLRALKTSGAAELDIVPGGSAGAPADTTIHPNLYDYLVTYRLSRIGTGTVPVTVAVNDTVVALPAIRARGDYMGDAAELTILDDEDNPLTLGYRFDTGGEPSDGGLDLQVVKIAYDCKMPAAADRVTLLERALRERRRAVVYDLYFDFNSADLRRESDSTLNVIAEVLRRNPDWKLSIEGHTDAVASDRYNLELSGRRAAAVKAALVDAFRIAGGRLTTAGYGESRPQDRNDTVEGRARNRRVELVRQ
jgi:outer membrane protein OmpA-like peptidoglycan-associated protein